MTHQNRFFVRTGIFVKIRDEWNEKNAKWFSMCTKYGDNITTLIQ